MALPQMSPENIKRVIATAKMATHCRLSNDPVWRKIDAIVFDAIELSRPLEDSEKDLLIIFVRMFSDPSMILFCRMEDVPLVGPELTPAQMLFEKLSDLKQEMLGITKSISSIKHLDKEAYQACLLQMYSTLRTAPGIGGAKGIYDWFPEQGCSLTTATVAVALCDEIYAHWAMMNKKTSPFLLKQSAYEQWGRRFKQIDLVLDDLRSVLCWRNPSKNHTA